jgi:ABC-2 type transport system ATP-binding protein
LQAAGLQMRDVQTQQSSLEDIFVDLVQEDGV